MRIAHIIDSLAIGGAERVAVELAKAQRQVGHVPVIYTISGEGALTADALNAGIIVQSFAKPRGVSLRTLAAITMALGRIRPDVVHTHNSSAHYYGSTAGFLSHVPVVVNTLHSPVSSRNRIERHFQHFLRFTNEVVFVSRHAQKTIQDYWPGMKGIGRVIHNGVTVTNFQTSPARPGSRRPNVLFGAVGRLVAVKAHSFLIEAFARLRLKVSGAELWIVGDGPLMNDLAKQIEGLGLNGCVHLLGARKHIAAILNQLDIFVIPSVSEGLPIVLLEAMATGLPIISTRVGGIEEVMPGESVGWFCEPRNISALEAAMLAAVNCEDLMGRGAAAAELARSELDTSVMAKRYEDLYFSLLKHPHVRVRHILQRASDVH